MSNPKDQNWLSRTLFRIWDLHIKYVRNPSNQLRVEWSLAKRLHYLNFNYNVRYAYALTFGVAFLVSFLFADYYRLVAYYPTGKLRFQSQYSRLVGLAVLDTAMRVKMQPHKQEIIDRGVKRGLSGFELVELSKLSQHPEIQYHGEYLAELKQN